MRIKSINFSSLNEEELPPIIHHNLRHVGFALVKNYPIDFANPRKTILELSERIGKPISHDTKNTLVWDIKSNPNSKSNVKTYSEHSQEALLHTDSQYSFYPEDYFSLLCVKRANCGGGLTYLLTLDHVLSDLAAIDKEGEIKDILLKTDFPFVVPNVFAKEKEGIYDFNYGPILRENEIRFRVDIIEKSLELNPDYKTKERLRAYTVLKDIILNNVHIQKVFLDVGDIIFINNKTVLHGRSSFTDSNRHLLRVRMNSYSSECLDVSDRSFTHSVSPGSSNFV